MSRRVCLFGAGAAGEAERQQAGGGWECGAGERRTGGGVRCEALCDLAAKWAKWDLAAVVVGSAYGGEAPGWEVAAAGGGGNRAGAVVRAAHGEDASAAARAVRGRTTGQSGRGRGRNMGAPRRKAVREIVWLVWGAKVRAAAANQGGGCLAVGFGGGATAEQNGSDGVQRG